MPRGRKAKLTPELQNRVVRLLRDHHFIEMICDAVGIGTTTFWNWMEKGDGATSGIYREFRDAVTGALVESEIELVDNIQRAAKRGEWGAAKFILERKFPARWGVRRLEVSGPDGGPIATKTEGPDEPLRVYIIPTPEKPEPSEVYADGKAVT